MPSSTPSLLAQSLSQRLGSGRILLLGLGREGESTYRLLRTLWPDRDFWISDEKPAAIAAFQQKFSSPHLLPHATYLDQLDDVDIIIKTPGIAVRLPQLQAFLAAGKMITTQLNEFLHVYRDQVIGVTGTKGKSTTTALIAHLLQTTGRPTLLAGNIGTPVFEIAHEVRPETTLVIEMSSYQLETCQYSPHWAIWLNIFPEHLNYHETLSNYVAAKQTITAFQTANDVIWYNQDDPEIAQAMQTTKAKKIGFPAEFRLETAQLPEVYRSLLTPAWWESLPLPVTIKRFNVLPALAVAAASGLSPELVARGLTSFESLPHRLETIGTYRGVTFVDDTLATIPQATIAALESIHNVSVLMVGGFDRGIEFTPIVDALATHHIPTVLFFPPSGEKMLQLLRERHPNFSGTTQLVSSMEEAVQLAYEHAPLGSTVLLSPASPSFGQFKDYVDKSNQFAHWVRTLANSRADAVELDST